MATKLLVALAILCVLNAALVKGFDRAEAMASFMVKMEDCKAEAGAKDADIEELFGKKPSSTMEGKCLRSCIMKKYDVLDNNGKFVKALALTHAEVYTGGVEDKLKIAKEMINVCADIEVASDHCEAAEQYIKCFKDENEKHGLEFQLDL